MVERRYTRSGEVSLSYLVEGDGRPVILIGAYGMSAMSWAEDGYLDALASDHLVIALDPLGTGRSDAPLEVEAYADERLVEHVAAVIEREEAHGAVLWGCGRGASIGQLYARRRPHDLSLVVCVAEYLGPESAQVSTIDFLSSSDRSQEVVEALERDQWSAVWETLAVVPDWIRSRVERDNDPWVFAAVLRAEQRRPRGFFPSSVPTIAIWGSEAPYHEANLDRAESLPIEVAVVPGDVEAYLDVETVVDLVRPYLARIEARRP